VSTGDYSEIIGPGPGWYLSSPGRKRNREDFTTAVVLVMTFPHKIAVLPILIGEGVAALNAT
jgi:hypothetical protein